MIMAKIALVFTILFTLLVIGVAVYNTEAKTEKPKPEPQTEITHLPHMQIVYNRLDSGSYVQGDYERFVKLVDHFGLERADEIEWGILLRRHLKLSR